MASTVLGRPARRIVATLAGLPARAFRRRSSQWIADHVGTNLYGPMGPVGPYERIAYGVVLIVVLFFTAYMAFRVLVA